MIVTWLAIRSNCYRGNKVDVVVKIDALSLKYM